MAWLSNDNAEIKIDGAKIKTFSVKDSQAETTKGPASFFKSIEGVVTEYITKQIKIPSTAFTPAFSLTTKQSFSKILFTISAIKQITGRIKKIADVFSKDNKHSRYCHRKEYVRAVIQRKLRGA